MEEIKPKVERRTRSLVIEQPISAGLEEDIEMIIYKVFDEFEKHCGPRFKIFTEVWHQTGFGLIFSGRESFREMFEFTEEIFFRIKKYALSHLGGKSNHPLVRYAAIYLLYSLYYKQPCRPRVKIRLLKDEFTDILGTIESTKQDAHWDVIYAWTKLFTGHAFHFVACHNQMGLEVALQMEQKEIEELKSSIVKEDYFSSKEFLGTLKKMTKAHDKYIKMKANLGSSNLENDKSLFLTDNKFPSTIRELSHQDLVEDNSNAVQSVKSPIGAKRRDLKYKFYGGGIDVPEKNEEDHDDDFVPPPPPKVRSKRGSKKRGRL